MNGEILDAIEISLAIERGLESAYDRYGHATSSHEGYGVLAEEVLELLNAIRSNDASEIQDEAIQCAVSAWRIAAAMTESKCRKRSGCV